MSRKIPYFSGSLSNIQEISLVYLETRDRVTNTDGNTQLARIVKSFKSSKGQLFEISLLSDPSGNIINSVERIIILKKNIMNNESIKKIKNRKLYYIGTEAIATNFANKELTNNNQNPLDSTSRSGLGSGIYGTNFLPNEIAEGSLIYEINITNGYDIQDKAHGESITTASVITNRYLDKIIVMMREENNGSGNIIEDDNIENLVVLWNIVFYRTKEYISYERLEKILSNYLVYYFSRSELIDHRDGVQLIDLPINYIMREMGYNGLLADDLYNNGWDRGCVSYDYSKMDLFTQGKAFY